MLTAVIGLAYGDEGKAAIVDLLSADNEYCVRYNGGANAGHTVVSNGIKHKFHLVPAGAVQGKNCILANGMAIDPFSLYKEQHGLFRSQQELIDLHKPILYISNAAHCVMPWHIVKDMETGSKIGTTNKGIGPCYSDKANRTNAVRMENLKKAIDDDVLSNFFKIDKVLHPTINWGPYQQYKVAAESLSKYICDTGKLLRQLVREKRNILFESANGMMIDVDFGTYPYVTSSGVGTAAIPQACGLPNIKIDRVVGIIKSYISRVGEGPFVTEYVGDKTSLGNKIREIGHEYGTTTGRPRRIGCIDLDLLKETSEISGATELSLMHTDVFNGFESVDYKLDNEIKSIPGWIDHKDSNLTRFIELIEEKIQLKIRIVSYGPDRLQKFFR